MNTRYEEVELYESTPSGNKELTLRMMSSPDFSFLFLFFSLLQ